MLPPSIGRYKALAKGETTLNPEKVKQFRADPHVWFGSKGKSKFWFVYKGHMGVVLAEYSLTQYAWQK